MLSGLPALGIRFDIGKIESGAYGIACWKIIWKSVPAGSLAGALLFEGDTNATLDGSENVYCIAVQSADQRMLTTLRAALEQNAEFAAVAAVTPFADSDRVLTEPLVEAGRIDSEGRLSGKAYNAGPALNAFERKEEQS